MVLNKTAYAEPEMEIVFLEKVDVICTSDCMFDGLIEEGGGSSTGGTGSN